VIGDLSDAEKVIVGLDLMPGRPEAPLSGRIPYHPAITAGIFCFEQIADDCPRAAGV
jgi:hypothetical protein